MAGSSGLSQQPSALGTGLWELAGTRLSAVILEAQSCSCTAAAFEDRGWVFCSREVLLSVVVFGDGLQWARPWETPVSGLVHAECPDTS